MDDRPEPGVALQNGPVEMPLRGGPARSLPRAGVVVDGHARDHVRLHGLVGNAAGCNQHVTVVSRTDVAGRSLVQTGCIHLPAELDNLPAQRLLARGVSGGLAGRGRTVTRRHLVFLCLSMTRLGSPRRSAAATREPIAEWATNPTLTDDRHVPAAAPAFARRVAMHRARPRRPRRGRHRDPSAPDPAAPRRRWTALPTARCRRRHRRNTRA